MKKVHLHLFDETLRDGEQQAGLFFPYAVKQQLCQLIAATGVQSISIMPAIDDSEAELAKKLLQGPNQSLIALSTMMNRAAIDFSQSLGAKRIILFHAVSDRLLFLRDSVTRSQVVEGKTIDYLTPSDPMRQVIRHRMLDKTLDCLQYAARLGLTIEFAAEDASRANHQFLIDCIHHFKPYLSHFILCDTVGVLDPIQVKTWVHQLLKQTDYPELTVHFHNDRGLALMNTVAAIEAGLSSVSGTFAGIGERAGNVSLDELFHYFKSHNIELLNINADAIAQVTAYLDCLGAKPFSPFSREATRQEAGIHIHALLHDPLSYPLPNGYEPEIWFGKYSGSSSFQYLFERHLSQQVSEDVRELIHQIPRSDYEQLCIHLKRFAQIYARSFSSTEVLTFLRQGDFNDVVKNCTLPTQRLLASLQRSEASWQ